MKVITIQSQPICNQPWGFFMGHCQGCPEAQSCQVWWLWKLRMRSYCAKSGWGQLVDTIITPRVFRVTT